MRVAISTGGGDAPGLNAVIRAIVLSAFYRGWETFGIRRGYEGLLGGEKRTARERRQTDAPPGLMALGPAEVRGITHVGGTILGTTNQGNPFEWTTREPDGRFRTEDRSDELIAAFREHRLDALIAIGGEGSLGIASKLHKDGFRVVGVPKTIDNDLSGTDVTFGFDTAVNIAMEAIDRLHSTAESHQRIMVVEVMGRHAGWIALHSGIAGGADLILIPEVPIKMEEVLGVIKNRHDQGKDFSIIVVAEGAKFEGNEVLLEKKLDAFGHVRLGGIGELLASKIEEKTGYETRVTVLGHIQRGGRRPGDGAGAGRRAPARTGDGPGGGRADAGERPAEHCACGEPAGTAARRAATRVGEYHAQGRRAAHHRHRPLRRPARGGRP